MSVGFAQLASTIAVDALARLFDRHRQLADITWPTGLPQHRVSACGLAHNRASLPLPLRRPKPRPFPFKIKGVFLIHLLVPNLSLIRCHRVLASNVGKSAFFAGVRSRFSRDTVTTGFLLARFSNDPADKIVSRLMQNSSSQPPRCSSSYSLKVVFPIFSRTLIIVLNVPGKTTKGASP